MKKARNRVERSTNAVAYVRVSTQEQADKELSLPAQLAAIRRYAQERGFTIVREYVERGITATDDNRPEFQQMRNDVLLPSSTVSTIFVTHTSRFMRNAGKARIHKEALRRSGIRVVAIQQEVSDDPSGRFAEGMFELVDQLESENNGVRTRAGMSENARQGFFNGSRPPFGFRVEKMTTAAGPKNKLAIEPSEAELVREVCREYVAGRGAKAVAINLNRRTLLYRGRRWTRDLVLKVLSEPAAIGTYYWGRLDSRGQQLRPESEWIAIRVDPIVDRELYDMVQDLRARRDPGRSSGRTPSSPLLLAGLLRCAKCGDTCQLESSGKCDPTGKPYRYYNCRRFCRSGKETCEGYRIAVDTLDSAILAHIAEKVFTEERCLEILREFVEDQGILRQKTAEQRRLLERQRDELNRRLESWYQQIENNPALDAAGAERIRELQAKRTETVQALEKLKPLHSVPPYLYKPETIQRFQARLRQAFLSGDHTTARVYLQNLVDHIVVSEDEIVIEARADAAISMMAGPRPAQAEATTGEVLADVVDWRPRAESNCRPTV